MRAAIYLRVSTNGQTTDTQEHDLRAAAKRMGHTIVEVYADNGISGAKGRDKRPAFDRLHRDAARRKFDIVMAWSVDRLGRSLRDLVAFLSEPHALGIELSLHQQGLDNTTPAGKAMFQMLASLPSSSARSSASACWPVWRGPGPRAPRAVSRSVGRPSIPLRYGFFYGPGTWYTREGDMGDQVRQQQVPIIGEGQGVYSFVHIDDAAEATAAALECPPGAYNIVDGNPSPQHLWLTSFARAVGAPAPPRVSEEEALRASGPDAVYYATRLRGASNEKAGRELEFRPRPLEWI